MSVPNVCALKYMCLLYVCFYKLKNIVTLAICLDGTTFPFYKIITVESKFLLNVCYQVTYQSRLNE